MAFNVDGASNPIHTLKVDGNEKYRAFVNGTRVYGKCKVNFNDSAVGWYDSKYAWWGEGFSVPGRSRSYYTFDGWFTGGGHKVDGPITLGETGVWDWTNEYPPTVNLYAHWTRKKVWVRFSKNTDADMRIPQPLPGSYQVDMGISLDSALRSVQNSYKDYTIQSTITVPYKDWGGQRHPWDNMPFTRFGWTTSSNGTATNMSRPITSNTTFYPRITDFEINVTQSGWSDLQYKQSQTSNGRGQIYVQGYNVTNDV